MMKDEILKEISKDYGTPSFVFNRIELKNRLKNIKKIIGEKVHLCYSIKANPFLIEAMLEEVEKLEVCSPGELFICQRLNVPGDKIIYSGVNKTKEDIIDAVRTNSGIYTAESILHVELLNEVANEIGKELPVLLRLNAGSQFGMSKEDLFFVIKNKEKFKGIKIEGIHYFAGTQRKKIEKQKKELLMLKELYQEIFEKYNLKLNKLEYGPGLSVPLFENEDFSDTLLPIKELATSLKEVAEWTDLTIEMGRFYVAECGYYMTKAMDLKSNEGINYCILDGGMNHLNYFGQIMGMKIPVIKHLKNNDNFKDDKKDWCLCGSLCTTADVVVRQIELNTFEKDDILAFCNVGAYSITEGIYIFLSRMIPRVLLYDETGVKMVRDFCDSSILNTLKNI